MRVQRSSLHVVDQEAIAGHLPPRVGVLGQRQRTSNDDRRSLGRRTRLRLRQRTGRTGRRRAARQRRHGSGNGLRSRIF
eukprot:13709344-Alexandrium_andersonii.AAC.1